MLYRSIFVVRLSVSVRKNGFDVQQLDRFVILELASLYNNNSISYVDNLSDGAFNVWHNSFPAEELPESHSVVTVAGVPFQFPPKEDGKLNTIVCHGQYIDIPTQCYDWLYLLAAAERRTEDTVYLHFSSGAIDPEWIRISDFWPAPVVRHFGEIPAFRCKHIHYPRHVQSQMEPTIWCQRIPVPRQEALTRIHLPDNIAIHIFAMTAVRAIGGYGQ